MIIRYEYISNCCNTGYIETRNQLDPMVYPNCVQCGRGTYDLVAETVLETVVVPETPVEEEIPSDV